MELKVWVDGVVRVVCGLSEETSCQDVVITLAQAIGQTGRYVLVQRWRDNERQLLANERLLETMAKLGQHAGDIQFFLHRTGPSNKDRPFLEKELPYPKEPNSENLKPREARKALTSTLGPSSSPKKKPKHLKRSTGHSVEQKLLPPLPSSSSTVRKDELLQQVLQQQARLRDLDIQMETLEQELLMWEQTAAPEEQTLEVRLELKLEKKLQDEMHQELAMNRQLRELQCMVGCHDDKLRDLVTQTRQLEKEIEQENIRQQPLPAQPELEESLGSVRVELQKQQMWGVDLEASLTEVEEAMGKMEALLEVRAEEIDELNKELRHCNLQHFIQQTGPQLHVDLHEHLGNLEDVEVRQCPTESSAQGCGPPPRCTAKQLMGHPRNLLNPLISSLHPEGVYV